MFFSRDEERTMVVDLGRDDGKIGVQMNVRGDPEVINARDFRNQNMRDSFFDAIVDIMQDGGLGYERGKFFAGKNVHVDIHVKYEIIEMGEHPAGFMNRNEEEIIEFVMSALGTVLVDESRVETTEVNKWFGEGVGNITIVIKEV